VICERALFELPEAADAGDSAESIEELRGIVLFEFVAVDAIGDVGFDVDAVAAVATVLERGFFSGTESRRCCCGLSRWEAWICELAETDDLDEHADSQRSGWPAISSMTLQASEANLSS
jgi:hypothetical protein